MSTTIAYSNVQLFRKVIQESLEQAHRIFSGEQEAFTYFVEQSVTGSNVRHILTVEGLQTLTGESFLGNEAVRNYILTLDVLFFANLGDRHALLTSLTEVLTDSLSYRQAADAHEASKILMPLDILERAAEPNEIKEIFEFNRWLIPVIAMILWSKPVYAFREVKEGNSTVQRVYKLPTEVNV